MEFAEAAIGRGLPQDLQRERLVIIGQGQVGNALAGALRDAGACAVGPLGREADVTGATTVMLCVPDYAIADAAMRLTPGPLVGHCSGATSLEPLRPHESFSMHPLMTISRAAPARFAGGTAAIAGSTRKALGLARAMAQSLGMQPIEIADEDRVAYHTAASIAGNFTTTVLGMADVMAAGLALDRRALLPLVEAAVRNWADVGAAAALTGPVARRDEETVDRQRLEVAKRSPLSLNLFDSLVEATRELAFVRTEEG